MNTADLSFTTMALERDADPRDVAVLDDGTVVVSQYGKAELLVLAPVTHARDAIDLSGLADADRLPEALRMATCGRRVFVQLRRVDHETGIPAATGAVLAVIDLDRTGDDRVIDADPATPGVQSIALAGRPNFDMPVDCAAGLLYVVEPAPVLQGGSRYQVVDLSTLTAHDWPVESSAEAGGVEVLNSDQYWLITHTDFGPGASSHLNLVGGSMPDTYNTFATEHVNDLAFDRTADLLFFPDPCTPSPANASCDTGIHIFHAHTGTLAAPTAIKVGFGPIEVVVSR